MKLLINFNLIEIKNIVKNWLFFFRKKWHSVVILFLSLFISFMSMSLTESKTKANQFEIFYTQLSLEASKKDFKKIHMEVKNMDKTLSNLDLRKCCSKYNYANLSYCPYSINLLLSYKDNSFLIKEKNDYYAATMLCPATQNILKKKNDVLKMETLDLYMLFEQFNATYNSEWCYISSSYADTLLKETGYKKYEDLLGYNLEAMYYENETVINKLFTIRSIYDSNLGMASYYEKLYGEKMIISFIPQYYQVDDTILSIDLTYSLIANKNTISLVKDNLDFNSNIYNYNFEYIEQGTVYNDINLYDEFDNYLGFLENQKLMFFYLMIGCLLFLLSFFITHLIVKQIIRFDVKKTGIFMFLLLYLIFLISYILIKEIGFSLVQSSSVFLWIIITLFIYLFSIVSYKSLQKVVMKND